MEKNYDIVLVGNGILASSLAYHLKKENQNLSIALVGPKCREGSATLAAGAMINVWSELGAGQFENEALATRFELTRKGGLAWESFAQELSQASGEEIKLTWGTYLIRTARSTSIEKNAYAYIKKALASNQIEHKVCDPDDLPWLKASQEAQTMEALWIKDDGRIDSRRVMKAFDLVLPRMGVDVIDAYVTQLNPKKDGFFKKQDHTITTSQNETISGKQIVLANGAYAQSLLDNIPALHNSIPRLLFGIGCGVDITMPDWVKKYGGLGREILDLDAVVRTPDRGGACGVHVVPYGDGRYYAGASSLNSLEPDLLPKLHGMHVLIHSVLTEINRSFFHAGITFRSVGCRPTSADTFPLIGETDIKGVWMLNGTKRDGFTMSAHIAKELSQEILGGSSTLPRMFKPCRSLISYKTKAEALKDAELMMIGADFQHGGLQAPYMVDKYKQMRIADVEAIYNKRKLNNFGIQPELLHLYENDEFYATLCPPKMRVAS